MASHFFYVYALLITFSLCYHRISSINFQVTNLVPTIPGGMRFEKEIGIPYTKQILGPMSKFIMFNVFQQTNPADQKRVDSVIIYIVKKDVADATTWDDNKINISSVYLKEVQVDLKKDFTGLLYHEMTHVFQWFGDQKPAPQNLVEGIADFTTIKANNMMSPFVKPGEGNKWDQGYDVTARFLEYCDGIAPGFVAKLNKKLRYTYNVTYFKELTGKPVDQLWKEYKAKYGKH